VPGRVEWSELGGDEAETVLANLLYCERPSSTRVRPSRGDFGIDVLDPSKREAGKYDIYQIKRYAKTLTASQKREVEDSFRRVLVGLVRRDPPVPLGDWYLVAPVDNTIDKQLDWFHFMPDAVINKMFEDAELALTDEERQRISAWRNGPGRVIKWEGRPFCETTAGKYPYVVDHYLHGGEERLRAAVADMTAIVRRDLSAGDALGTANDEGVALVTPAEISSHLDRIFTVLDTDPHYRYEFSVDLAPPEITRRENMIAATQAIQLDGRTLTFRVYQRFVESQRERPIPFTLRFAAEDASFDDDAYDSWRKYGTPLSAPAEVQIDLPGGLSAPFTEGLTEVFVQSEGTDYVARFRIRGSDGTYSPTLTFAMAARTGPEQSGVWESGADQSGYLTFETRTDLETGSGTWGFSRARIVGQEIDAVLPSIEFLQRIATGNVLEVGQRVGPFVDYHEIPSREAAFPDDVMHYLRALSVVQTVTPIPVLTPDLKTVNAADASAVVEAAALISGQTVFGEGEWAAVRFKSDASPTVGSNLAERAVSLDDHYEVQIIEPLIVNVGEQELTLGAVERRLLSVGFELRGGELVGHPLANDTQYRRYLRGQSAPDRDDRPVRGKYLGTRAEAFDEQQ
jgi:hypothetical protein